MSRFKVSSCAVLLACWACTGDAAAEARAPSRSHHAAAEHGRRWIAPSSPPSRDAAELARLAPPSSSASMAQNYGDAAYGRSRGTRSIAKMAAERVTVIGPSAPRDQSSITSCGNACDSPPSNTRYREGYAYTPSFLSAPQRLGVPDDVQSPLLSPLTGLAWLANNLRYDPHN